MTLPIDILIWRLDDWHVHLRDGDVPKVVLPYAAAQFGRTIIMPNLKPSPKGPRKFRGSGPLGHCSGTGSAVAAGAADRAIGETAASPDRVA